MDPASFHFCFYLSNNLMGPAEPVVALHIHTTNMMDKLNGQKVEFKV